MQAYKQHGFLSFFLIAGLASCLSSCQTMDLYEKSVAFPKQQWQSSNRPSFTFNIKDTTAAYQLYIVLRHTGKYNYNNLWVNLVFQAPGGQLARTQYELPLAVNEKWLGTGMDDIYEHRIALNPSTESFHFNKMGVYTFTLEQIMREDPLMNVLNVGLRIEKKSHE